MGEPVSKLAVILGGGNGIGAACCRLMSERGWKVVVADLDGTAAKAVGEEIGAPSFQVDVRDSGALEKLAGDIERHVGPVYSLVVSAGAFHERYSPFEFPTDVFRDVFQVNVEGTFNACKAFGAAMVRRRMGSIVNISTAVVHASCPMHAYGPSKAAVNNMTRALAVEWGRSGVRVNSLSPGSTLVERQLARKPDKYRKDPEGQTALGRRIQPLEIAEGVEFLASDRASAITGTDLLIDAGLVAAGIWGFYGGIPAAEPSQAGA